MKMKINVFGKKRTTEDGKKFYTYFSRLTKKDGTDVVVEVKFREEVGAPKKVPCTIEFDRKLGNFSEKEITYDVLDSVTGEVLETKTTVRKVLWISDTNMAETEYIDTSMEDFV